MQTSQVNTLAIVQLNTVEKRKMLSLRSVALSGAQRAVLSHTVPRAVLIGGLRHLSTPSKSPLGPVSPKAKAQSIIDAMPRTNFLTKTGIIGTSAAAAIYAISNELYVLNEESILFVTFLGVVGVLAKFLAPFYNDFAEARIQKISDILNASRKKHVDVVKERIESVSQLQDVAQTTKVLFDVSKETVELEAEAFELKQKVQLAQQAKAVLDSWVRYEASLRELERQQIAEGVIKKVQSELKNPDFQNKVLQQAVDDVERLFAQMK